MILGVLHGVYQTVLIDQAALIGLNYKNGYIVLGAVAVAMVGMVVGTVIGTRKLYNDSQKAG